MNTIKPGIQTSEFWLTTAISAISYFCMVLKITNPPESLIVAALSIAIYTLNRMGVKIANSLQTPPPVAPTPGTQPAPTSFTGTVTLKPEVPIATVDPQATV